MGHHSSWFSAKILRKCYIVVTVKRYAKIGVKSINAIIDNNKNSNDFFELAILIDKK